MIATAVFLLAAMPLGIAVAAWAISVAMRLRDPHASVLIGPIECPFCGGSGGVSGTLHRLAGGACDRCGARPTTWVIRAELGGAAVPVLALYVAADPMTAAWFTLFGWLLLAIWITDELSLWIPHVFWALGLVASFAAEAHAGGARAAAVRACEAAVLVAAVGAGALAVRLVTRVSPVGAGDFGVLAFLGAALGYEAVVDVLLLAGVIALGVITVRAAKPAARRRAGGLATVAMGATALVGVAGALVTAPVLAAALWRGRARARATALPLGACLAAATFILLTWTAPHG
jgi:prepilin signal peptidase PulO-like enzyme (type II secretory pathway)